MFFQMCATLRCPRRRQFRSVGVQVSESECPRCEQDTAFVRFRSHSLHGGAERLERARSAGEFARQQLEGTRSRVPPTPPLSRSCQHLQNWLYVIVRGWCGEHGFTYRARVIPTRKCANKGKTCWSSQASGWQVLCHTFCRVAMTALRGRCLVLPSEDKDQIGISRAGEAIHAQSDVTTTDCLSRGLCKPNILDNASKRVRNQLHSNTAFRVDVDEGKGKGKAQNNLFAQGPPNGGWPNPFQNSAPTGNAFLSASAPAFQNQPTAGFPRSEPEEEPPAIQVGFNDASMICSEIVRGQILACNGVCGDCGIRVCRFAWRPRHPHLCSQCYDDIDDEDLSAFSRIPVI